MSTENMIDDSTKALWERMRDLHATGKELPEDWLQKAEDMEAAANAFWNQTGDYDGFLGCWARARRLWCQVTGEPMV